MQAGPVTSAPTATSPPLFLGEHRALDFLNTLAAPAGEVVEWVGTGEDLVDWLVAAQLVPGEVAQRWRGGRAARRVVCRVVRKAVRRVGRRRRRRGEARSVTGGRVTPEMGR